MNELKEVIIPLLVGLITGLGGVLGAYLHSWTKRIKEKDLTIKESKERICKLEGEVKNHYTTKGLTNENKERITNILENLENRISKLEEKKAI